MAETVVSLSAAAPRQAPAMTEPCFKRMMVELFGDATNEDADECWEDMQKIGERTVAQ
jgi:hypothetical protein